MSGLGAGSCNHPGQTQVGSEVSNVQNLLPVSSRPDVGRQPNWGFKRCSPNLQDLCTDVPESPGVTCAGKRGAPTPGPRASGSELGMATTMAEGWEEGPGHRHAVEGQAAEASGDTEFHGQSRKLRKRDQIKAVHELSYCIDINSTPN